MLAASVTFCNCVSVESQDLALALLAQEKIELDFGTQVHLY